MKPAFLVFSALVSRETSVNSTGSVRERNQPPGRKSLPWKWSVNNLKSSIKTKKTEDGSPGTSPKLPKRSGFVSPPKRSVTMSSDVKTRVKNSFGTLR